MIKVKAVTRIISKMAENKGKNTQLGKSSNSINNQFVHRMTAAGQCGET